MLLENTNGEILEFNITDYQFPLLKNNKADSNWLLVSIAVKLTRGEWTASDPSMLTTELASLINWFRGILEGHDIKSWKTFIEPNLQFELVSEGELQRLRIYFELELRPAWAAWKHADMHDLYFDIGLNPDVLKNIIDDLEQFKTKFPTRA